MAPRNRRSTERSPSSFSAYSRAEFAKEFPDDDACLVWLRDQIYPDGIWCKNCERVTSHYRVKARPSFSCQFCGHHVHPTAGTIFHKSSTSLHLWFQAIYLMSATRCGISAKQLEREIGVNYKTAHRMFRLIRSLLADDVAQPLTGDVEMDETFLTPRRRANEAAWPMGHNPRERVIMGSVQRHGRIVARYVGSASGLEAMHHLRSFVLPEATVFTDESPIYRNVAGAGYTHKRIKHSAKVYVVGDTHTNTVEAFWSNFKRGLSGVYHSVSSRHLQSYVDEYSFRYNHRFDRSMFHAFLARVALTAVPSASASPAGAAKPS